MINALETPVRLDGTDLQNITELYEHVLRSTGRIQGKHRQGDKKKDISNLEGILGTKVHPIREENQPKI